MEADVKMPRRRNYLPEWEAIEEVATSREDEFERKLGYSSDILSRALDNYTKIWDEFPEFRDKIANISLKIIETFRKHLKKETA